MIALKRLKVEPEPSPRHSWESDEATAAIFFILEPFVVLEAIDDFTLQAPPRSHQRFVELFGLDSSCRWTSDKQGVSRTSQEVAGIHDELIVEAEDRTASPRVLRIHKHKKPYVIWAYEIARTHRNGDVAHTSNQQHEIVTVVMWSSGEVHVEIHVQYKYT